MKQSFRIHRRQAVLHVESQISTSVRDLLQSKPFAEMLGRYYAELGLKHSARLKPFGAAGLPRALDLIRVLATIPLEKVVEVLPDASHLIEPDNRRALHEFVEGFYDYWRDFDRFMVLHSEPGPSSLDQRPYRSFNATLENLDDTVRALYRDVCENITGAHPRVYRQVTAGCDVGLIAVPRRENVPSRYAGLLGDVPFIRQVMINPPLILDPPSNTRTGQFERVATDPLEGLEINPDEWLCFPARVGSLTIFAYFHEMFIDLGCSLANLFELADDADIAAGPDAIYLFGADKVHMSAFGALPTVFHDAGELLVAAVPGEERFGYFGYLKKMILTLHNIVMIKRGRLPFHGAMVRLSFKSGKCATMLLIGDTATGKSETLEALRQLSSEYLDEMRIIADDMGSLEISPAGRLKGYGTEIGAFVRLDDLGQDYAFKQMDRSIFMSPQKVNSRVVVPVTTLEDVLKGYEVNFLLYANNYEQIDADHPILEAFADAESALNVFRAGAAMSKGTTTATGLVHSYFANIFGAPQYREQHEPLARATFEAAIASGVQVAQLRTRLGVSGFESSGPLEAAKALLEAVGGQN
ncbi:MAG: hypothetical protein BWY87_00538 [Deltaproteobacteria bacterium ADurb.Bin510]|nr:MAG: hypothetical protein BWY87_00538 [Deltaproteobacteria bacterium ADurb.Bin510]